MAQDIFLKINGIDGESQDSSHKNEIEVLVRAARNSGWHSPTASQRTPADA
jgi:type VI secretion system secreted protein Hcp